MKIQNIEHIPAGCLKAGKAGPIIYQTYLGSCLGVALYDKSTGIGGIIHILLPEPPSFTSAEFHEKYASSGVPLLIAQLKSLGARISNLEASIAGGALVGPVSPQDINLDIGGRSADIAVSILESAGIKTIRSETGGFFSCTLELNMTTGDTSIQPVWQGMDQPGKEFEAPTRNDIFKTIDRIKPIPQTALKLFRMFNSPQYRMEEITKELSKDQVLSGQTLKLCNSALFTGVIKIETLKDAVMLLGEDMLIKSVITAAVDNYYSQTGTSGYSLCKGGLFFHAVAVASAAEKIAEFSGKCTGKLAYTAGLLHDIGKVVLDQYISDGSPLLFRDMTRKNVDFISSEKKILGTTHSEAGALLAEKWNFSDNLRDAIQWHHVPEKTTQNKDIVTIIYLADLLMEKFSAGFDVEKNQTQSLASALGHLGISMADLPELIDAIPFDTINSPDLLSEQKIK